MPLLVSCLSEGLLLVDGDRVEPLDRVPSAGLAVGAQGVARAVYDPAETATRGEILLERGRRVRVDGLLDAHELAWDGDLLACVSTLTNAVLWIDVHGRVVRRWQAPGDGDCWHLSGVVSERGRVLVTAFGRFARHRDWAEAERVGSGFVVEVPSGRLMASGLSSPHSPRILDGRLAVCDSGRCELLVGDRRVDLGGWTRGLALTGRELVVGVSTPRGMRGRAHLAVLRRSDLTLLRRIRLPVREVFDLVEVSAERARALVRLGPDPVRTAPLRPADLRVAISAPRALRLRPDAVAEVVCTVTNLGSATLASVAPHPVSIVSAWQPGSRALWSPLPRPLEPGDAGTFSARLLGPAESGRYRLELRLVQQGVAWFAGVARAEVTVA